MARKMIVAIDFDGTIVKHEFPKIGPLLPGAKEKINFWYDNNLFAIIIWTCRGGKYLEEMKEFLDKEGIKYHKINENAFPSKDFNPYPKIYADFYIDDRAVKFEGWEDFVFFK